MRFIELLLIGAATAVPLQAQAQESSIEAPSVPVISQVTGAPSKPASYVGSLRLARALVPNTSGVPEAVRAVSVSLAPQLKADIEESIKLHKLPKTEVDRLAIYLETLPVVVDEVLIAVLPLAHEQMAWKFSGRFSAEEADGIAIFFESAEGTSFFRRLSEKSKEAKTTGQDDEAQAVAEAMAAMSAEDLKALINFTKTPAGKAFKREEHMLDSVIAEAMTAVLQHPLQQRVSRDLCREVSRVYCSLVR